MGLIIPILFTQNNEKMGHNELLEDDILVCKGKGKLFPLRARCGPEGE